MTMSFTGAEPISKGQLGCQLIDNTSGIGNICHPTLFKTSPPIFKATFHIPPSNFPHPNYEYFKMISFTTQSVNILNVFKQT